jgi:hypothetical protein
MTDDEKIRGLLTHSIATAELCRIALGELSPSVLPETIRCAHEERPEWAMRLLRQLLLDQEAELGDD